jgi:hypothetical protein
MKNQGKDTSKDSILQLLDKYNLLRTIVNKPANFLVVVRK